MGFRISKYFGPSTLITAAFIGPGTITVCTMAGVKSGYSLLWAMLFSIITTIILQEMAARLGLITQKGLGDAIRIHSGNNLKKYLFTGLAISAVLIGNIAYEAGNIAGAILGADLLYPNHKFWTLAFGLIAFIVLRSESYKRLEKFLIALVILMSICFLLTAILLVPSIKEIFLGFIPTIPNQNEILLVMALVGTTVVPYNLFLHASLISKKYKNPSQLRDLRIENAIAILLGGLISLLVIIVSASGSTGTSEINNASDLALQLEPLLGAWAKYLMALGLMAAGLSSAITAPLAAALASKELFNWNKNEDQYKYKLVWMLVLAVGILFSVLGYKPITIIQFAQVANAILLPVIASYLIYICNKKSILREYTNSALSNLLGIFVIIMTLLLSFKTFNSLFSIL